MTSLQSLMNDSPITVESDQSVAEAARLMAEHQIGDVIVTSGGRLSGIVTDRDLAIRVLAEDLDGSALVSEICTNTPAAVSAEDGVEQAIQLMRDRNVRRLPVVEDDTVVGVVSLGDLARASDAGDILADISAAPANN